MDRAGHVAWKEEFTYCFLGGYGGYIYERPSDVLLSTASRTKLMFASLTVRYAQHRDETRYEIADESEQATASASATVFPFHALIQNPSAALGGCPTWYRRPHMAFTTYCRIV